jgi:hypothetical protein
MFAIFASLAGADETLELRVPDAVAVPDDELRQITTSLLERYPQLAGSPGVKVSGAYLGSLRWEAAYVIYYPHIEGRGIRAAVEAHCHRTPPRTAWTCDDVRNRRYLQLAAQAWEVRLLADLSSEAAFALIEASRRDLGTDAHDAPTAISITDHHGQPGRYLVSWGTPDGVSKLTMDAALAAGGNPTHLGDWRATIFEPPPLQ